MSTYQDFFFFSLLHLLISPRLFLHPCVHWHTVRNKHLQCITICNSKQIFICMHTTPTHILNPDPTIRSTLLALLQLVSCEHQFSIHYIEVFCCEAVCLCFAIFSNIFLQTTSTTLCVPLPVNLLTFN